MKQLLMAGVFAVSALMPGVASAGDGQTGFTGSCDADSDLIYGPDKFRHHVGTDLLITEKDGITKLIFSDRGGGDVRRIVAEINDLLADFCLTHASPLTTAASPADSTLTVCSSYVLVWPPTLQPAASGQQSCPLP
jgi:hypothetical protein